MTFPFPKQEVTLFLSPQWAYRVLLSNSHEADGCLMEAASHTHTHTQYYQVHFTSTRTTM